MTISSHVHQTVIRTINTETVAEKLFACHSLPVSAVAVAVGGVLYYRSTTYLGWVARKKIIQIALFQVGVLQTHKMGHVGTIILVPDIILSCGF